jgi:hypothetical protein
LRVEAKDKREKISNSHEAYRKQQTLHNHRRHYFMALP